MTHILIPDDPIKERNRLRGQARHCRALASACDDSYLTEELIAIANSYEAKASLLPISGREANNTGAGRIGMGYSAVH